MNGPRFSVIIPNFNNGETLKRAVDSILAQTWPAHEIIIIDDGSTDHSREVVDAFGDRVIVRYQQNAGVSVARNLGATIATGNWLAFLDADDAYFPDRLKVHADWLAAEPDMDFLLGDQEHCRPDGEVFMRTLESCAAGKNLVARYPGLVNVPMALEDFDELIADGFAEIRTLSVPRTTFQELKGFPVGVRIGEDLHFIIRLCARSKKAGAVTAALASYYIYSSSALRKNVIKTQQEFVRTLAMLTPEMQNAPLAVSRGHSKKLRRARLSLAYAYLRENRKADAIRSVLPTLVANPNTQSVRDVLSIIKGLPKT